MSGTPLASVFVKIQGLASAADFKAVTAKAARDLTATATIGADTKPGEFDLRKFQARLAEVSKKVYDARLGVDDKEAAAKLAAMGVKLTAIGRRVENPRISVDGALKAEAQLLGVDAALDRVGSKSEAAGSELGGLSGVAMPAVIAAGAALSPVVATLGAGFAGLAAAAIKTVAPMIKAAGGGKAAAKAWLTLDPAQKAATQSLIRLKQSFGGFAKALEPQTLALFSTGLRLARNLMGDVQPVAKATGVAFNQFLGQFGATLQDPQWKQFWAFMAENAGPDVRLLGANIVSLTEDLPPLLRALQPVAQMLLTTTAALLKVGGGIETVIGKIWRLNDATSTLPKEGGETYHQFVQNIWKSLGHWAGASDTAAKATDGFAKSTANMGSAAWHAGRRMVGENTALTTLTTGFTTALTPLMNYITAQLTESASLKSLSAALKLSHDRIGFKTAAERASFAATQTYIKNTLDAAAAAVKSGKGVQGEIGVLRDAIPRLEAVKGKTAAYRQELGLLKAMLDKLRAEKRIHELITVTGTGHWAATSGELPGQPGMHFVGRYARGTGGARRGWAWVGEKGAELVRMSGGEQVIPHGLSRQVASYAAGTMDYSGSVAGLRRWAARDNRVTERTAAAAIAMGETAQMAARFAQAFASLFGAAGGGSQAAARLFRRMYPEWARGALWAATNYVAMRESGWNTYAANPTSTARGVAQRIQGWAPFYRPGNAYQQDRWFHDYMLSRYGGPLGAAAHERMFNWYGSGLHAIVRRPTLIGVGERGPERVDVTPARGKAGGTVVNQNFGPTTVYEPADVDLVMRRAAYALGLS